MRAWQYTSNSGPLEDRIKLNSNLPVPHPEPSQHLVRTSIVAVNPVDYKPAEVYFISRFAIPKPATPGIDFAGHIVIPAEGSSLKEGQAVWGVTGKSPFAGDALKEYIVPDAKFTLALPDGVHLADAATIGVAGQIAYGAIVPKVRAGQNVFINGGSGGVGAFAIQIAKILGCHVTTACSTANVDFCQQLGADVVLDYKKGSVADALKLSGCIYDHIVDNVCDSPAIYFACKHFTRPDAEYVMIGWRPEISYLMMITRMSLRPSWLGGGKRKFSGFFQAPHSREALEQIGDWMREGKIKAVIDSTFPFENAVEGFERSKTLRARGKILVEMSAKQAFVGQNGSSMTAKV